MHASGLALHCSANVHVSEQPLTSAAWSPDIYVHSDEDVFCFAVRHSTPHTLVWTDLQGAF
jgi:hypothetical protein